jgi:hypothetical protein
VLLAKQYLEKSTRLFLNFLLKSLT